MPSDSFGNPIVYAKKTNGEEYNIPTNAHQRASGIENGEYDDGRIIVARPNVDLISTSPNVFALNDYTNGRIEITTSAKYNASSITPNFNDRVNRGYTQSPQDWRNCEAAVEFKILSASADGYIEFWFRTGKDISGCACEGFAYKAGFRVDGNQQKCTKQMYRGQTFFTTRSRSLGSLIGKWCKMRTAVTDIDIDGNPTMDRSLAVKALVQCWMQIEGSDTTYYTQDRLDDGFWGLNGETCQGSQAQVGNWGGPIVALTFTGIQNAEFKSLNVREIDPTIDFPIQPPPTENPPPIDPPEDPEEPPPPAPGTGLDNLGIQWKWATGPQDVIPQSRFNSGDYRWSDNRQNVSTYGYEVTAIVTFSGVTEGDGHMALKHWGPNHTSPCGYEEDGECCCWYDDGIRDNGDIQTQTERPHPSNDDYPCPECTMSNIGVEMDGNTIGLKWVVFPLTDGGSADNGGIRKLMYVSVDALDTNGRPKNNWVLVFDITDNGQILGDYEAPTEHDIEMRISDTDDADTYGGGLHFRRMVAGDKNSGGTGGGTTPPPVTPPPTQTTDPLVVTSSGGFGHDKFGVRMIYRSDTNKTSNYFAPNNDALLSDQRFDAKFTTRNTDGSTGGGTGGSPDLNVTIGGVNQLAALNFIKNSYKSSVQMLEEAPTFNVFWLWNDQLLGQIVLKHIDSALAQTIENKMNSFGVTMQTPWATLDPQYRSNFSVKQATEPTISAGPPTIRYSHYGGVSDLSYNDFADIAFLSAIHYFYTGNLSLAQTAYDAGKAMWDGQGMDDAGNITGEYAVYKVALGLLAQKITGFASIGIPTNYFAAFQHANGGITTDKTGGVPDGSQNIETTAAVLLALNPSLLNLPSSGSPTTGGNTLLWDSNIHGLWNNGSARTIEDEEGNQSANGKGLYMAASGDPRLIIDGAGIGTLEADAGHGRFYVKANNFNAMLEGELRFDDNDIDNFSFKLRSRHQMGGDCENRFGGIGGSISRDGVTLQIEICHNDHLSGIDFDLPEEIPIGQWITFRILAVNDQENIGVITIVNLDYGNGMLEVARHHVIPNLIEPFMMDRSLYMQESEFWMRVNNESTGSISFRNVKLWEIGDSTTLPPTTPPTTPPPQFDGTYSVPASEGFLSVYTDAASKQEDLTLLTRVSRYSYNYNTLHQRKAWDEPNTDFRNVECKLYFRAKQPNAPAPQDFAIIVGSVNHEQAYQNGCGGSSYQGCIDCLTGKFFFVKEQYHGNEVATNLSTNGIGNIFNKLIGFCFVVQHFDSEDRTHLEIWTDVNNNNTWTKQFQWDDTNNWGQQMTNCNALLQGARISWGSPKVLFEPPEQNVDVKFLSVREIQPGQLLTTTGTGTGGGGGGGSGSVARIFNHWDFLYNTLVDVSGFVCTGQDIAPGVPYVLKYNVTTATDDKEMAVDWSDENDRIRVAIQLNSLNSQLINIIPRQVGFWLKKVGNPTGTLYVQMWDAPPNTDTLGNVKVTYGSIDVSTLPTEYPDAENPQIFTNDLATVLIPNGMKYKWKLGVYYEGVGSDENNYVAIAINYNNPFDSTNTDNAAWEIKSEGQMGWNTHTGRDLAAKIWV